MPASFWYSLAQILELVQFAICETRRQSLEGLGPRGSFAVTGTDDEPQLAVPSITQKQHSSSVANSLSVSALLTTPFCPDERWSGPRWVPHCGVPSWAICVALSVRAISWVPGPSATSEHLSGRTRALGEIPRPATGIHAVCLWGSPIAFPYPHQQHPAEAPRFPRRRQRMPPSNIGLIALTPHCEPRRLHTIGKSRPGDVGILHRRGRTRQMRRGVEDRRVTQQIRPPARQRARAARLAAGSRPRSRCRCRPRQPA